MNLKTLYKVLGLFLMTGGIILGIGLYYMAVKAGIPYQDPPPELQTQYMVNMGIGNELTKVGGLMAVGACVARIVIGIILKKKKNDE